MRADPYSFRVEAGDKSIELRFYEEAKMIDSLGLLLRMLRQDGAAKTIEACYAHAAQDPHAQHAINHAKE